MKKLSELMLEGYAMVGRQCANDYCLGDSERPSAVCAVGAAYLAATGNARWALIRGDTLKKQLHEFYQAVGLIVSDLNDEGMSIPDIAGIAAAEGL